MNSEKIYIWALVTAILCYLIGSVNFSVIFSRKFGGEDVRNAGSGNAGATNMLRNYGVKLAIPTFLCDVAKGALAPLVGMAVTFFFFRSDNVDIFKYVGAVTVIVGHSFPIFFGFKGGKGVSSGFGAALMLDWRAALIVLAVAALIMLLTRYVSLGSIIATLGFVVVEIYRLITTQGINYMFVKITCVLLMGIFITARHHANISRLMAGTENKFGKKKDAPPAETNDITK